VCIPCIGFLVQSKHWGTPCAACRDKAGRTRPHTKKGQWTEEEELVLAQQHRECGNKWAAISKFLPTRTDNDVKNHWNSTLRSKSLAKHCTFLWCVEKRVGSWMLSAWLCVRGPPPK
jgi:hypothetical protein